MDPTEYIFLWKFNCWNQSNASHTPKVNRQFGPIRTGEHPKWDPSLRSESSADEGAPPRRAGQEKLAKSSGNRNLTGSLKADDKKGCR